LGNYQNRPNTKLPTGINGYYLHESMMFATVQTGRFI
jgi:hypothetical protein